MRRHSPRHTRRSRRSLTPSRLEIETLEPRRVLDSTVVFSELMYNPAGDDNGAEWIELYNQLSVDIDLSRWQISGGATFEFPAKTRVPPGGFVIIAQDTQMLPDIEGAQVFGPLDGRLSNGGEAIRLLNANDRVMDEVDYNDRGAWPVGPDGSGSSLAKRNLQGSSEEAGNWMTSLTIGGSPGVHNGEPLDPDASGLRLYEVPAGGDSDFWIELHNPTDSPRQASDYSLKIEGTAKGVISLPDVSVAAGGWLAVPQSQLNVTPADGDRLFLVNTSANSVVDAIRVDARPIGRSIEQQGEWWFPTQATPGQENQFDFETNVVINEIMYNDAPTYATGNQPFEDSKLEWIELYNRGDATIDLSGWRATSGIRFELAEGSQIAPGQFVVLTGDRAAMLAEYPGMDDVIIGEFTGRLSNRGESLLLVDATGNPANRVHYYDGGRWPEAADGGGSSLELIDSDADNNSAESWAASREGEKSQWQEFSYRGTAREPLGTTNPRNGFNELIVGLLDAGEVLVDDLRVVEDPDGAAVDLLQNGSFELDVIGQAANKWRAVGNHRKSVVVADPADPSNQVLRISATGAAEHMSNHVETTFVDDRSLKRNAEVEVSFRARWLSGSPLLNTRLYFNQVAETTVLALPARRGTPGALNSTTVENAGPTFQQLRHDPLVPSANEAVTVTVRADDPDDVASILLYYSVNSADFQSVLMSARADGLFAAEIPGQRTGRTVQFYVRATDALGATGKFPAAGPESRALYRVGARSKPDNVKAFTLMMTSSDVSFMHTRTNVMSNDRLGGTVIFDNQDVFYDIGVRLRGSGYGRNDARTGFNVNFDPDRLFRGVHSSVAVDRGVVLSPGTGQGPVQGIPGASPHELLIHHIANNAGGLAGMYDDIVYFDSPRSTNAGLGLLKMSRYGNRYLDSQFENGSDGSLFELELIYYLNRATVSDPEALKSSPNAVLNTDIRNFGDDKDAYRLNYILKNNRDRDDFSRIIQLGQSLMLRGDDLQTAAEQVMDVEAWMRYVAFQSLVGTADTFNQGLAHNLYLFVRPEDQRVVPMPWDVDHGFFHNPKGSLTGTGGTRFSRLVNMPQNKRLVYKNLLDIIETTYNLDYLQPWIDRYTQLTQQNLGTFFTNYVSARSDFVPGRIEALIPKTDFSITTNDGQPISTEDVSITIVGQGWVNVDQVRLPEGDVLPVRWTDETSWEVQLPVRSGINLFELAAFDLQGREVGTASIEVTGLGNLPGDFDGDGQVTAADINLLCGGIDSGDSKFDLDGDGQVDSSDSDQMIHEILGTTYGDANLDGKFDSGDLIAIFQVGQFEDATAGNSGWAEGDWNCDGDFTTADLVVALADGGFVAEARTSVAIDDLAAALLGDEMMKKR